MEVLSPPSPAGSSLSRDHFCVLTIDLVSSTALALDLPLTIWSELLGQWSMQILEVLRSWGGWILPLQGDAALACWPAWQTEAAVSAARRAHQQTGTLELAGRLGLDLQLRAGMACGELALLPHMEPRPCGLPLHLSRRLCSAADPGETLLCHAAASVLERDPGGHGSILHPRLLPPLAGFERVQRGGAPFYRLLSEHTHTGQDEMKAG